MRHEADIRQAMRHFSRDTLELLYADTYRKICSGEQNAREAAMGVFALLLGLHETLSPDAYLNAVMHMTGRHEVALQLSDLLRICSGMVVLDSQRNTLRFVHASAQDFLETQPSLVPCSANRLVARSCLSVYIFGLPAGVKPELYPVEAFYHYGALYWADHCSAVLTEEEKEDGSFNRSIEELVFDNGEISLLFLNWLEEIRECEEALPRHHKLKKYLNAVNSPTNTPLFLASSYGFAKILRRLDGRSVCDWSQKNDLDQSGLYLACANGRESCVRFFIDCGADIHSSGGKHGSPLQAACFNGHSHIVQLLLDSGADPQAGGAFDNALQASVFGGQQDVSLLLLEQKFELFDQDSYEKAFHDAAEAGFVHVVQHLQQKYDSTYAVSDSGQSRALGSTIYKGQRAVLERFFQKTNDPRDLLPTDSVAIAALGGQNEMVSLLLDIGLGLETESSLGSPLRVASLMGHESTVRLLLDRGANVSAIGRFGPALQAAAARGHVSLTQLLLREGAKPNDVGGHFGNALQAAAYYGHEEAVKTLLQAGAKVHDRGFSKDAFHAAIEGGQEHIVRFFLERGMRPRSPIRPIKVLSLINP